MTNLLPLLALIFSTPEFPDYTSKICIMTFSSGHGVTLIEVHVGTEPGIYTDVYVVPSHRLAMTCEDLGIAPGVSTVTYYRRTVEYHDNGYQHIYDAWPAITVRPRPRPPVMLTFTGLLKRFFPE
jgi:hypothetical protein